MDRAASHPCCEDAVENRSRTDQERAIIDERGRQRRGALPECLYASRVTKGVEGGSEDSAAIPLQASVAGTDAAIMNPTRRAGISRRASVQILCRVVVMCP